MSQMRSLSKWIYLKPNKTQLLVGGTGFYCARLVRRATSAHQKKILSTGAMDEAAMERYADVRSLAHVCLLVMALV